MGKQSPKMTALVVSAIRNLREVQGSTPKEILNYIVAEYNAANQNNDATVKRKLATALKRGLEYGILKHSHGHYSLNTEPEAVGPAEDMLGPMERSRRGGCKSAMKRKRRRRAKKSGCKGGGRMKRGRRRGRGGGGRKRRGGRKGRSKGGCKSKGSRRRRSRRGKSRKSCGPKRRRSRRSSRRRSRGKKCGGRRDEDVDMLVKDPIEQATRHRENLGDVGYAYDREERRSQSRGRQSAGSRSRTPSHSRSSGSSDREVNGGNRRERQAE